MTDHGDDVARQIAELMMGPEGDTPELLELVDRVAATADTPAPSSTADDDAAIDALVRGYIADPAEAHRVERLFDDRLARLTAGLSPADIRALVLGLPLTPEADFLSSLGITPD